MKRHIVFVPLLLLCILPCRAHGKAETGGTDYLTQGPEDTLRYPSEGGPAFIPFFPVAYTARYHIIAFFEGHQDYESLEAFVFSSRGPSGDPLCRAILTRHDKTQIDFVNFSSRANPRRENYQTEIRFEYRDDGTAAMLSLVDHRDNALALVYVADHPVSAAYGGMTDVRGHSPQGGLPLFYREKSGIASEGSYVRINNDKLRIPLDKEATHKPFFIGLQAYVSEGYNCLILPTGTEEYSPSLFGMPADGDMLRLHYGPFETSCRIREKEGTGEIRSLAFRSLTASPERESRMEFNPAFPNLSAMPDQSETVLRFSISFDASSPVAYGDLRVKKTASDRAEVLLQPAYPEWANQERGMLYNISWNESAVQVQAAMAGSQE